MLLLYTHQITNRVRYTFNLIFKSILEIDLEITADKAKFIKYTGAKISYAAKPVENELFFQSSELLFETGLKPINELPEDMFAISFFIASRYEEYLPFEADK